MIEISYVLTTRDLMEAGQEAYRREPSTIRHRIEWVAFGLALIGLILTQKPSPLYWLILFGLSFIWNGIKFPLSYLKSHYQKSVTGEQIDTQISENGVRTESPTAQGETKWAGIKRMIETPDTFSLVTNGNTMYVLPKRAFNKRSIEEFQQLIAQKGIPNKPR